MIVNVNQCASTFDETLHALKYSAVAKQVGCAFIVKVTYFCGSTMYLFCTVQHLSEVFCSANSCVVMKLTKILPSEL